MGDTEALSKHIAKMMAMMQSMNAKIDDNMKTQSANMKTLQERMGAISFDTRAGTSSTPSKAEKDIPVRSCGLANEPTYGFSGGPWPNRAVGRERGHRRTDGGGDWNVRPIGAAPYDSHPNSGDYRNSEGLMERGHTGTVDEYCSQFEECLSRQTRLSGDQQLWQFCAGLTDNLRKEVEYFRPETIFEAMEFSRDNEYKIDSDK
ncbi:hypothetical protein DY000_02012313 [Brassica cretica]|uniref:Retrotransposon gag domain-containing protein n=1 Tax=Brassica cretica TaxID=69181 RepID=A0ABQ7D5X5_BRACR|nr:hypothetical protein DY000_02012313 [Brassica cretica]